MYYDQFEFLPNFFQALHQYFIHIFIIFIFTTSHDLEIMT